MFLDPEVFLGRAWRSQDSTGAWLKTEFDPRGYAVRLCESSAGDIGTTCTSGASGTWLETLLTDARGNVLHERRGGSGALEILRMYDERTGRLLGLCAGINCRLQDEQYEWDFAGNLLARDKAGQYREVFSYDPLNRLTRSSFTRVGAIEYAPTDAPLSSSQSYDKLGNICSKLINGVAQSYRYGGLAGCGLGGVAGSHDGDPAQSPHAVTGLDHAEFAYDLHGNQTDALYFDETQAPRSIAYTVADQAWQIVQDWDQSNPQKRTRFWYGPDGSRYQRIDESAGVASKRTLYVGNLEIVSQGGVTTTRRYVAGIAVEEWQGSGRTPRFMLHDHLGSVVALVDANAMIVEAMDYGPFGERRGNVAAGDFGINPAVSPFTARGFTGHEMIEGTDIVHMNGRIYDHRLGRFLQADPFVQEPNNPQNFNRYTYVLNNPLSLTDPSGFLFKGIGKFFRRALAAVLRSIEIPSENPYIQLLGKVALNALANLIEPRVGGSTGVRGAFSAVASAGLPLAQLPGGVGGGDGGFGNDFVQAGYFTGVVGGTVNGDDVAFVTQSMLIGGTDSVQTGGKFANGADSETFEDAQGPSTTRVAASVGIGFIPVVGSVQSIVEVISGKDFITGERTSRLLAAAGIVAGLLPAGKGLLKGGSKLVSKLIRKSRRVPVARGGAGAVQVGRAGEDAVRAVFDIGPKARFKINGRSRIADGLTDDVLTEVKNVQSLSFTRQLRDSLEFAENKGLRFDLFVRPGAGTRLSGPLEEAVWAGRINLRFIPSP